MVACELLVPCGLTTDIFCICFSSPILFSMSIFPHMVHIPCFYSFIFFSHPAQHTDNTDFFPTLPTFPPFPLPWIPVHPLVGLIEVASVAPGVCSRLPFCVQYIKHAEPIRRLGTMKNILFHSLMWSNYSIIGFECETYIRIQVLGFRQESHTEPERTER